MKYIIEIHFENRSHLEIMKDLDDDELNGFKMDVFHSDKLDVLDDQNRNWFIKMKSVVAVIFNPI